MTRYYTPETHDPILTELNQKWRRTDREIADEMGFDKSTIRTNRIRLKLPINWRPRMVVPQYQEPAPRPQKEKPNPLLVAAAYLGTRLVEKPSGYFVDNVPANLDTIMRETNLVRVNLGMEQITHKESWRV